MFLRPGPPPCSSLSGLPWLWPAPCPPPSSGPAAACARCMWNSSSVPSWGGTIPPTCCDSYSLHLLTPFPALLRRAGAGYDLLTPRPDVPLWLLPSHPHAWISSHAPDAATFDFHMLLVACSSPLSAIQGGPKGGSPPQTTPDSPRSPCHSPVSTVALAAF